MITQAAGAADDGGGREGAGPTLSSPRRRPGPIVPTHEA